MSYKPLVLIVGPTGSTGLPIVNALLESGDFRVAGLVRPASSTSPGVKSLRDKDIAIHALDWVSAPLNELTALLKNEGVEILISTCPYPVIDEQTKLVDAAKAAGTVKRFVPSDWATVCPPGVMALEDRKRKIEAYAEQLGMPYTSIVVGLWNQASFPPAVPPEQFTPIQKAFIGYYGTGEVKNTVVNRLNLGRFVPSILKDERTIRKRVLAHEDEVTLSQVWEWADKYSGKKISENKNVVTVEQVEQTVKEQPGNTIWEYINSLYVRGDNSVEAAKNDGYLIAQELYPEVPLQSAEEWAKEYYSAP